MRKLWFGLLAFVFLAGLAQVTLGVRSISFDKLRTPSGTRYALNQGADGTDVTILPVEPPDSSYASYGSIVFPSKGAYCRIAFQVDDDPYKISIVRVRDETVIAERAGIGRAHKIYNVFKTDPGKRYLIALRKTEKDMDPLIYKNVRVSCVSAVTRWALNKTDGNWTDTFTASERLADEQLEKRKAKTTPRYPEMVALFDSVARRLKDKVSQKETDDDLRAFVRKAFETAKPYLESLYGDKADENDDLAIVFANYLSHFAVSLSRQSAPTPRAILKEGSGTCWQQAQVTGFLYELLTGKKGRIVSTDANELGHTVLIGDGFIADTTDNLVIFQDHKDWNQALARERISALQNDTIFGISLVVHPTPSYRSSENLFGLTALREGYKDTIRRLPFTVLLSS